MANRAKGVLVRTLLLLATRRSSSTTCCYSTASTVTGGVVRGRGRGRGQGVSLSRKLSAQNVVVQETLDGWVTSGRTIKRHDIITCVNHLRRSNNYQHALQLHEWMEKREIQMNNADRAIHIDLLAKTKGLGSAEEYFNSLEDSEKSTRTYGALLCCYCKEKMTDKASDLFEKMKDLSFTSSLNYNNMMSLYLNIGEPEKAMLLEKEMEEMNITADLFTYSQLINCHASLKDYDAIDGVLEKMRAKKVKPDWLLLSNIATIYVNAKLFERASVALKDLENMNNFSRGCEGFQSLICLYARMDNLEGVNRAWEALRATFEKPKNESYLILLLALLKLKDVCGLEKWFAHWETNCSMYDIRLGNVMLESYLERNMINEANALYERVIARGIEPNLRTLDLFINDYLKNKRMDLALKFLEMGISKVSSEKNNWFPSVKTVDNFLELIKEEKDEEMSEKFYAIMKQFGRFESIQKSEEV